MSAADDTAVSAEEALYLFDVLSHFPALILAVSGGPDSTALMVLAARWRNSIENGPRLIAVTVDHGLRAESKREAAAVKKLAHSIGIEHRTLRWTGAKPKTGLQEAARTARYSLLAKAARAAGARYVLTAHTLDDQAETVLFRMARGSGLSGLVGMTAVASVPVEGTLASLFRPFLRLRKSRLIATLKVAKIAYAEDPSNQDPRFTRSRLRALAPALAEEGLTAERLALLARRVERVENALYETLNDAQTRVSLKNWARGEPVTIKAEAFHDLPEEICLRLLGRAIAFVGNEGPVELGKLEVLNKELSRALDAALLQFGDGRFRRTLAGALISLKGHVLTVERAPPRRGKSAAKRP